MRTLTTGGPGTALVPGRLQRKGEDGMAREEQVRIRALSNVMASGEYLAQGKIHTVTETDAGILIRMGKAELATAEDEAAAEEEDSGEEEATAKPTRPRRRRRGRPAA